MRVYFAGPNAARRPMIGMPDLLIPAHQLLELAHQFTIQEYLGPGDESLRIDDIPREEIQQLEELVVGTATFKSFLGPIEEQKLVGGSNRGDYGSSRR